MMTMMQSQQFGGPPPAMDVPSLVSSQLLWRRQYRYPLHVAHDYDGGLCGRKAARHHRAAAHLTHYKRSSRSGKILWQPVTFFLIMLLPTLLYYSFVLRIQLAEMTLRTRTFWLS